MVWFSLGILPNDSDTIKIFFDNIASDIESNITHRKEYKLLKLSGNIDNDIRGYLREKEVYNY